METQKQPSGEAPERDLAITELEAVAGGHIRPEPGPIQVRPAPPPAIDPGAGLSWKRVQRVPPPRP